MHRFRTPLHAVLAETTEHRKADDGPVPWFDIADPVAHRLYGACTFVAQHCGQGHGELPFDIVQVAVTDPGGPGAHKHLVGPGPVHVNLFDFQRDVDLPKHCRFHRPSEQYKN